MNKFGVNALWIYLAIGPIYWVPGVAPSILSSLKLLLFVAIFLSAISKSMQMRAILFPGGTHGFAIFALIFALTIPGSLMGVHDDALYRIFNILQIVIFMFSCKQILHGDSWIRVAKRGVIGFCLMAFVCAFFIKLQPNLVNPFNSLLTLSQTGFGGLRTGWSPAMAIYLPWALGSTAFTIPWWVSLAFSVSLVANQIFVDGRSGLVASVVAILGWSWSKGKGVSCALSIALIIIVVTTLQLFPDVLRLDTISSSTISNFNKFNDFSSGRIAQYVGGAKYLSSFPLTGAGFGRVYFASGDAENYLHNEIYRLAAEGGIPLAIASLLPIVWVARTSFRYRVKIKTAPLLTIVAGFVISQFEPMFIYGNFNVSVFWWFCFFICVSVPIKSQKLDAV